MYIQLGIYIDHRLFPTTYLQEWAKYVCTGCILYLSKIKPLPSVNLFQINAAKLQRKKNEEENMHISTTFLTWVWYVYLKNKNVNGITFSLKVTKILHNSSYLNLDMKIAQSVAGEQASSSATMLSWVSFTNLSSLTKHWD